tara:strand:- start:119435 stop:119983 length:549 start_codon:yes stop_codon:yes gene_type:complete
MPKDIRDILKEGSANSRELNTGHRARFEERLVQLKQPKKNHFFFLKIAASIVLLLSVGYFALTANEVKEITPLNVTEATSLSSISPEMKQIENYYVTAINYEIASLDISDDNQAILDEYLEKIGKLTEDYQRLDKESIQNGINEKTVNALITNLQLRLQILLQLKDKLNEIKTSKKNEDITI